MTPPLLMILSLSAVLSVLSPLGPFSPMAMAAAQEPPALDSVPRVPSREEAAQAITEVAREAVARGFAGQILAVRAGEILVHEAFGEAGPGMPMDVETVFAIGSVTKQFTKAAILRLEEQGRLSTSDPVSRFIDGLPQDKQAITLDQLLAMEAGLGEYHDDSGDHQPMTKEEALERIGAQELLFEPGTDRATQDTPSWRRWWKRLPGGASRSSSGTSSWCRDS
jgi:CubicO group peptidase (beta-lactamase class C family)